MIHPSKLHELQPPCVRHPGLHKRIGLWACAQGITAPAVHVDRGAEGLPGFEALMFHESLHVIERHALLGIFLAVFPPAWVWWRREQELRADVFALEGAGAPEFYSFARMHPHPTGRFWRWCYGQSPDHRMKRAQARWKKERKAWHES